MRGTRVLSFTLCWLAVAPLSGALAACRNVDDPNGPCQLTDRYPAHVVETMVGGAQNTNTDGHQAEGAPNCGRATPSDVSLGGGSLVLDLGCMYATGPGPDLKIWESDASYAPCQGIAESFDVLVSADRTSFVRAGSGFGPTALDVTAVASFRYVKIVATDGVTSGPTPGADIDAVELLQIP